MAAGAEIEAVPWQNPQEIDDGRLLSAAGGADIRGTVVAMDGTMDNATKISTTHRGHRIGAWLTTRGWWAEAILPITATRALPTHCNSWHADAPLPCTTSESAIAEVRRKIDHEICS